MPHNALGYTVKIRVQILLVAGNRDPFCAQEVTHLGIWRSFQSSTLVSFLVCFLLPKSPDFTFANLPSVSSVFFRGARNLTSILHNTVADTCWVPPQMTKLGLCWALVPSTGTPLRLPTGNDLNPSTTNTFHNTMSEDQDAPVLGLSLNWYSSLQRM